MTSVRLQFNFVGDTFPHVDRWQRNVRDVALELFLQRIDTIECAVSFAHAVRDACQLRFVFGLSRRKDLATVGFEVTFQIMMLVRRYGRREIGILIDEDVGKVHFE